MRVRARLRIGFYCLVLGSSVWLVCFPAFVFHSFLLFWCIGAALFALLMLLGGRLGRLVPRPVLRVLDIALLNLCIAAVASELGLRIAARLSSTPLFARANSSTLEMIRRHRLAPGTKLFDFPVDSRGYHDRELSRRKEGEKLVVSIGDSFSVGIVPHYFHFTTVCERLWPGLEVYNMGINAIGPDEYLHLFRAEALPLGPDAVVVCIYIGNDIAQAVKKPHAFLRSWFDRENLFLYLVPRRLLRIGESAARPLWAGEAPGGDTAGIAQDPVQLVRRHPWLADPSLEKATYSGAAYFEMKKLMLRLVCRTDATALHRGIRDVLREMDRVRGEVPLLVVLLPDEFQVEDEAWNRSFAAEKDRELLDRTQPQRLLVEWLGERGIPCLDLLPLFRKVAALEDGSRHLYHLQDTHLNVRGNRVAGESLAGFLQAELRRSR